MKTVLKEWNGNTHTSTYTQLEPEGQFPHKPISHTKNVNKR